MPSEHLQSFTDEHNPKGATEANLVRALATPPGRSALSNLSIYSQRLSRQFERIVTQLRDLQKARLA